MPAAFPQSHRPGEEQGSDLGTAHRIDTQSGPESVHRRPNRRVNATRGVDSQNTPPPDSHRADREVVEKPSCSAPLDSAEAADPARRMWTGATPSFEAPVRARGNRVRARAIPAPVRGSLPSTSIPAGRRIPKRPSGTKRSHIFLLVLRRNASIARHLPIACPAGSANSFITHMA